MIRYEYYFWHHLPLHLTPQLNAEQVDDDAEGQFGDPGSSHVRDSDHLSCQQGHRAFTQLFTTRLRDGGARHDARWHRDKVLLGSELSCLHFLNFAELL